MRNRWGLLALAGYIATIFAANWAIEHFGVVPVGFGLMAPAGVYFAGLAFSLRDVTHETLGAAWVVVAIFAGAAVSWFVNPAFAVASATAFLLSELADFAVYTPLRERHRDAAYLFSNLVGLVLDSLVFLWLAFGSLEFFWGQVVGKLWVTLIAVAILKVARRERFDERHRKAHERRDAEVAARRVTGL